MKAINHEKRINIQIIIISIIFLLIGCGILISSISIKNKLIIDIVNPPLENDENYDDKLLDYQTKLEEYRLDGIIKKNQIRAIIIRYNFDNQQYINSLNYYSDEDLYDLGKTIDIYILNNDPNQFKHDFSQASSANFFFGFGIVIIIISFLIALYRIVKLIKLLKWFSSSIKVKAKIVFVEEKENKRGKYFFTAVCSYMLETNEEKILNSQVVSSKENPITFINKIVEAYVPKNIINNQCNGYINLD